MQTVQTHHPASLRVFFATEMWERYGFYVVQTLLALYLVLHFNWPDKRVYTLVGSFTALTYLSPLVGGWIADHWLGQKRTILSGAVVLLCSYLGLSLTVSDQFLNASLAGIAVGTGLLKPNISSLLGNEYPHGSPHRENGFMIFYMGLTTGIILGTTLPSYLNHYFGWSASFLSAVFGMIMAMLVFSWGIHRHRLQDYHVRLFCLKHGAKAFFMTVFLWLVSFYILTDPSLADVVFATVAAFSIGYFFYCIRGESGSQARQTMVLGMLCLISVMFWAFYFQMFLSFTLFITRAVQPSLFGVSFPAPFYVGVQSIGMIVLGLFLVRRNQSSTVAQQGERAGRQFLHAMYLMTLAYVLIVLVCQLGSRGELLSPLCIIPAYLIISLAEMLLSPVGLSAVTLLASRKKVSTLMGIFLASLGVGAYLSGKLALLTAIPSSGLSTMDVGLHYATGFTKLSYILMVATLSCVVLNRFIQRFMKP